MKNGMCENSGVRGCTGAHIYIYIYIYIYRLQFHRAPPPKHCFLLRIPCFCRESKHMDPNVCNAVLNYKLQQMTHCVCPCIAKANLLQTFTTWLVNSFSLVVTTKYYILPMQ
jgi:hypothetical protein